MRRPHINITQKFVIYLIIISIIPLLIVGISSFVASDAILQQEASRYSSVVVTNQRDYLELQLEQIEGLMANISSVEEITNVLGNEDIRNTTSLKTSKKTRQWVCSMLPSPR